MTATITLDPETEHLLRRAMREQDLTLEAAIQEAIRRGLGQGSSHPDPPFTVRAKPMRLRAGLDPTHLKDLDAALEVEAFKALTARLQEQGTR